MTLLSARLLRRCAVLLGGLACAVAAVGCRHKQAYQPPEQPMPPNTVLLSQMMRELSAQPGFTEKFLEEVQGNTHKAGAALLTPELVHHLRDLILGSQWERLDRFPGWTMREINPTVKVASKAAGKDPGVDSMATAGGAPSGRPGSTATERSEAAFLDLPDEPLNRPGGVDLDEPAKGKGFDVSEYVSELGDGVTRGDGPNPERAEHHAESARLAEALNRLSMNGQKGVAPFHVVVAGNQYTTPQDAVAALMRSGHEVMVADSRYFANFGHLHYKGRDVMMPFWVNVQVVVPHTKRSLLVPVSHAEYEWFIRGPKVNAEVSFYFGIDGKAEFRTMDQLDQAWVMNRHAREYHAARALEVTRLSGLMVQAYEHEHERRPKLPFGGYYALGVCQDVVAAIELKMTGKTTLFPNTAEARLFDDPRDAEINGLIRRIPKDREGTRPEMERVFGSLPVGDSDAELNTISIPGLSADLLAVHDAWTVGSLERERPRWERWSRDVLLGLGMGLAIVLVWWLRPNRYVSR